jgi:hypothetical protein
MPVSVVTRARQAGRYRPARQNAAAGLLAAACVAWSALPMPGASGAGRAAATVAAACAVFGTVRLAVGIEQHRDLAAYHSLPVRVALWLLAAVRAIPWPEGLVIAAIAAEATHGARPYHTGLLAAALLGYLFAMHLAESGARPAVLRPQLPLIAAGLGLLVIATGASMLPDPAGPASDWLRVLAIIAALLAGCLALPT